MELKTQDIKQRHLSKKFDKASGGRVFFKIQIFGPNNFLFLVTVFLVQR